VANVRREGVVGDGTTARGYGWAYQQERARLLAAGPACVYCSAPATTADHRPPLSSFADPADWVGELVPACKRCNFGRYNPANDPGRRRQRAERAKGRRWIDRWA
jgi:5-methylcytosine-specific restriction endonuclease McrA